MEKINIADLMKNINEQIWRFEQKYHIKPKFLKVGTYVLYALKNMTNTNFKYLDTMEGSISTFMGLLVCDTPAVQGFSTEVF